MMAGMTPIRTSLRANVVGLGGDRDVAGRHEAEPARPRGAVDAPDDGLRRLPHRGEDRHHAAGPPGRRRGLGRAALLEVRARGEDRARPGQHDHPHGGIRERRGEMAVEIGDELPRQRIAIRGRVERDGPDAARHGQVHQLVRHHAASFGNCPGCRPSPGGPANACANRIHSSAAGPVIRKSVSATCRRWVTTRQKSRALPRDAVVAPALAVGPGRARRRRELDVARVSYPA